MTAGDDQSGFDLDLPRTRPMQLESSTRSPLPWFLIAAGVVAALTCIAGGATALFLSRQDDASAIAPTTAVADAAESPREIELQPANADACEALGLRLEQTVSAGNADAIGRLFAWQAFVERAAKGLEIDDADRASYEAGVRQGSSRGVSQRLADAGVNGGRFDYLRTVERDGRPRALCRLITAEGLVDFFEYLPMGSRDSLQIGDFYSYSTGEDLSTSLRRGLLAQAVQQDRGVLDHLTNAESDLVRHREEFARLMDAHANGRWQETLDLYEKLPESLQLDNYVLVNAVNAAMLRGGDRFDELVDRFRKTHPESPAIDLLIFNDHYLKGEIDRSIATLRRLDAKLNGDAFVKWLIAGMLIEQEKYAAADSILREAVEREPDLSHPYMSLVGSAIANGDYTEAIERLDELERVGQRHKEGRLDSAQLHRSLAVYSGSAAFFGSKEFAEWEASRRLR